MAGNTFGNLLKLTTWGESHGPSIGGVLDGCPAGIALCEADMQKELDRRRPGQSDITTQRKEPDRVRIVAGVFDGVTTGAPVSFIIDNVDKKSGHYEKIKDTYRPGHADYTYDAKYGIRDWRGGGRSSARETAVRVAAGAMAKKIIPGIEIVGYTKQVGNVSMENFDRDEIEKNPVRAPDADAAKKMVELIEKVRKEGDSIGGVVEIRAFNVPPGLGVPVYHKLSADLAHALMGINAVKGIEIGEGFRAAAMRGSEHNDGMDMKDGKTHFMTNHAGGILGGISNGDDLVLRIAVKPTPSISSEQETVAKDGSQRKIRVEGRHDPCICPRVVPVAEAMVALVLADHALLHKTDRA